MYFLQGNLEMEKHQSITALSKTVVIFCPPCFLSKTTLNVFVHLKARLMILMLMLMLLKCQMANVQIIKYHKNILYFALFFKHDMLCTLLLVPKRNFLW